MIPRSVVLAISVAALTMWPGARVADAQTLRGVVQRADSRTPIAGATIAFLDARDSVRRVAISDAAGKFIATMPAAGVYALNVRRVGFLPLTTSASFLRAGDTLTLTVTLPATVATLDTVVTRSDTNSSFLTRVTPGHEMVERHFALGRGIIVSGADVEKSGLLLSEYLGRLNGIVLTGTIGRPAALPRNPFTGGSPPVVPAAHGKFLTSVYGQHCLYARIDHWSIFGRMMEVTGGPTDIDLLVQLKDLMAVEVYKSRADIPEEWQEDAWPDRIVYVRQNGGYFMGDVGIPKVALDSLVAQIHGGGAGSYTHLGIVPPGLMMPIVSPRDGKFGADGMVIYQNASAIGLTNVAVAADLGPNGYMIPTCGFMQIWTKASW